MDSNWKKLICVLILQIAICVHGRAPKIEDNNRWAIERQYTAPRTPPRELRFCVDPEVEKIFDHKRKCLGSRRIVDYIGELRDHDSSEYSRSNELFAYHYFVESPQNTLRTNCEIADFEYIPFLPLHWVRKHAPTPECSYTQLIKDIQRFWAYKSERDKTIHYSDPQSTQAPTVNVVGCCGTVVNGVKSIFTSNKKIGKRDRFFRSFFSLFFSLTPAIMSIMIILTQPSSSVSIYSYGSTRDANIQVPQQAIHYHLYIQLADRDGYRNAFYSTKRSCIRHYYEFRYINLSRTL